MQNLRQPFVNVNLSVKIATERISQATGASVAAGAQAAKALKPAK